MCRSPGMNFPDFDFNATRSKDFLQAGNSTIINCKALAPTVARWLAEIQRYAKKAQRDSALGVRSPNGFQALFKDDSSKGIVQSLFGKIATGAPVFKGGCLNSRAPDILCVNDDPAISPGMRRNCNSARAFISSDFFNMIMLCPTIFYLPEIDDRVRTCPSLVSNKLVPNDQLLSSNPQSVITEELAHMHLGVSGDMTETYKIQDAVDLPPPESLDNAPSYGFYFAGMCWVEAI